MVPRGISSMMRKSSIFVESKSQIMEYIEETSLTVGKIYNQQINSGAPIVARKALQIRSGESLSIIYCGDGVLLHRVRCVTFRCKVNTVILSLH